METKFTKGAWSYQFTKQNDAERIESEGRVEYNNGEGMICIVTGSNYGEYRDVPDCGDSEFEANAKLIAAPPDMYEALKEIIEDWKREANGNKEELGAIYINRLAYLKKVFAKATEQSGN